jgi:hypothetical protein
MISKCVGFAIRAGWAQVLQVETGSMCAVLHRTEGLLIAVEFGFY